MDKEKIEEVQCLIEEKISSYTTTVLHTEGGKCKHFELTLSFRKDEELDNAIRVLQQSHR